MAGIVLKQTSSGGVIQEMDSSDKDYLEHVILTSFAALDSGVGTLSVNPADSTGLTHIGTFTDTKRNDAIGTHPVVGTNITTVTYKFYQDLGSDSEFITNSIRPLALTDSADLQIMSDSQSNDDFISNTQENIISGGLGMYKLSVGAPTGGTWTAKSTITNNLQNTSNTIKLWRKTAAASTPTTVRPLKYDSAGGSILEMSDSDINKWLPRVRNRIVAGGVGQYKVQASAPGGGTWIQAGSPFTDTRYEIASQNYTQGFTGYYSGSYTGAYVNYFSGTYVRSYGGGSYGYFSGTRTKYFSGTYSGTYAGTYTGTFAGNTIQSSTEDVSTVSLWVRQA